MPVFISMILAAVHFNLWLVVLGWLVWVGDIGWFALVVLGSLCWGWVLLYNARYTAYVELTSHQTRSHSLIRNKVQKENQINICQGAFSYRRLDKKYPSGKFCIKNTTVVWKFARLISQCCFMTFTNIS